MRKFQDKSTIADIEAVIQKESEGALRRIRSADFASSLKSRLDSAPAPQPFFVFRKPVFVPVLGVLILAAATFFLGRAPGGGNSRVESGFRFMTDSLGQADHFRTGGTRLLSGGPDETSAGSEMMPFAAILFRAAASNSASESAAPAEGGAPLRPLFSPMERFKILYGDQAILRVLQNIASQQEV